MHGGKEYYKPVIMQLEKSPTMVKATYLKRMQESHYLRPTSSFGKLNTYNIMMSPLGQICYETTQRSTTKNSRCQTTSLRTHKAFQMSPVKVKVGKQSVKYSKV
jgi:hypothetical protein